MAVMVVRFASEPRIRAGAGATGGAIGIVVALLFRHSFVDSYPYKMTAVWAGYRALGNAMPLTAIAVAVLVVAVRRPAAAYLPALVPAIVIVLASAVAAIIAVSSGGADVADFGPDEVARDLVKLLCVATVIVVVLAGPACGIARRLSRQAAP